MGGAGLVLGRFVPVVAVEFLIAVDVRLGMPGTDLLLADVAAVGQFDVTQQPAESVAVVRCQIGDEFQCGAARSERAHRIGRLGPAALNQLGGVLGRVDADQPDLLVRPVGQVHVDRVAVGRPVGRDGLAMRLGGRRLAAAQQRDEHGAGETCHGEQATTVHRTSPPPFRRDPNV